jgi:hypothetical protein
MCGPQRPARSPPDGIVLARTFAVVDLDAII